VFIVLSSPHILNNSFPNQATLSIFSKANNPHQYNAAPHRSLLPSLSFHFFVNSVWKSLNHKNIAVHIIANLPSFFTASFCFSFFIHHISSNLSAIQLEDFSIDHDLPPEILLHVQRTILPFSI
jgi:hypothetical protein